MMNQSLENNYVLIEHECEGENWFCQKLQAKCPVRAYWIENLMRDKALAAVPKCFYLSSLV